MRGGNRASPPFQPGGDSTDRLRELQQPNTPAPVRQWASSLPAWASVQTPKTLNLSLDVDAGEMEAICLAREINAAAVLMDDRAGRSAAIHYGLAVIGTIGLLEQAAARGLLDLPQVMDRLRQTNARLNPDLVNAALERDKARKQAPPNSGSLPGTS